MPPRDLLLILVACCAWAFNFIASATALQSWPPFLFTIVRFVLVALLLAPVLRAPPRQQWPRLIFVCLANGGVHFALFFFALGAAADITSIAILMQVYVPMAAALAWVLNGERFGWRTSAAIAVSFCGVLLVGFDLTSLANGRALAFALAAAFSLALGTTYMRGLHGVDPFSFQGWTALLSLPVLALASALFESGQLALLGDAPWQAWGGALYSAVAASIIGHGIFFYLVRRHPVANVTPYLLLTPVLAIVFGVTLWGDQPGWRLWLGGSLVLGGVLIISLRGRRRLAAGSS